MPGKTFMADTGYIMVADRHAQFVKDHPNGVIETNLAYGSDKLVVVKCSVWKERPEVGLSGYRMPDGTGMASMPIPGPTSFTKNSEVENAETSALGRALAMIGYHPKERFASEDEIRMKDSVGFEAPGDGDREAPATDTREATPAQKKKLMAWGKKLLGDEKAVREFVKKQVGVYKSADLTRAHIDTLFTMFKVVEASGGTMMDGISDE